MFVQERFVLSPFTKRTLRSMVPNFGFGGFGAIVFYRCVSVGTKVLTKDLQWVDAETLRVGDELVGVDEFSGYKTGRKFRVSVVEDTDIRTDTCVEVQTDKGAITVNLDHPFLAQDISVTPGSHKARWVWAKARDLTPNHLIRYIGEPWKCESGDSWLAGMCDGEGSISNARLHVAQRVDSELYPRISEEFRKRQITCCEHVESSYHRNHLGVVNVNGTSEMMKALGTIRPARLLNKWIARLETEGVGLPLDTNARVQEVVLVGERKIVNLQTSTRTFVSNGFVSHNTYSRMKLDGSQETWADTVIRVIEGVMSIEKDWCAKNRLKWDEAERQTYARNMAISLFNLEWSAPGRGLFVGGTDYVYERGAAAHQNCGARSITKLSADVEWIMSMLLQGVGIGFDTYNYADKLKLPKNETELVVIEDTREAWTDSVKRLIESYERGSKTVTFDYSKIRPAGAPIKGFGGTASGPEPLQQLHEQLRDVLAKYALGKQSAVRTVADTINMVGSVVVAGGARRTALIALGDPHDQEFLDLKNYDLYPERRAWGWTSNNTAVLRSHEDFTRLPDISERAVSAGEPGVLNMINMQKYGRLTEERPDYATLVNPCGEQPLESSEVCCLADVFEPRCATPERFMKAIEYATFYASVIALLPTQSEETNAIIAKNRRTGVSISGIAEWLAREHVSSVITRLRKGYTLAREVNAFLARKHGVPESVRVTTIKPNGSTSQLAGVSPGIHLPPYGRYIRRMRVQKQSPIVEPLIQAGIPFEDDKYSQNTYVFEYPVDLGKVRGQKEATVWEKAAMANMMQRHWSDNNVSVTLTFDAKTEARDVDSLLAFHLPYTKALTILPEAENVYEQPPYEGIPMKEFERRVAQIRPIDWSHFEGSDGRDETYCNSDTCEI